MDNEKKKKSRVIVNVLFAIALGIVGIFAAGLIYLESLAPAMLFVNDTDTSVDRYLLGAGSPGIHLTIDPNATQFVDMPSWWGKPNFPRNDTGDRVRPRWDFVIFEIYYISDFPESW